MRINLSELAKLLLIYIIGIVLLLMMWSCNPVKQVLADIEKVKVVRDKTDPLFPCANDSLVFIHDSTTVVETEYLRDTLIEQRNDTTFVNYFDTAVVTKTVTKNIQTVVTDKREVNKHIDTINNLRLQLAKAQGTISEQKFQQGKMQGERNLWRIAAIVLFGFIIFGAVIKLKSVI